MLTKNVYPLLLNYYGEFINSIEKDNYWFIFFFHMKFFAWYYVTKIVIIFKISSDHNFLRFYSD